MLLWVTKHLNYFFLPSITYQDPGFFEMVEYFFHKSTVLAEDNLIDEEMKTMKLSRDEKVKKAHGV